MEFAFTEEQAMIAETAQSFFRENATSERTRAAMDADGIDRRLWSDFCQELGLGGILVPEKYRGAGLGHAELAIVAEAAGATGCGPAFAQSGCLLCNDFIRWQ